MTPRLNAHKIAPDVMKPLLALEASVAASGLEKSLIDLVKIRASQVNGCAYCIHMHTAEARGHGESEERIYLLDAWAESPLYTDRERAALGWTEALTRLADTHAPDSAYEPLQAQFSETEIVKLTMLIATINAWNRFGVGFRLVHPTKGAVHAA